MPPSVKEERQMKRTAEYYDVRSIDDTHGLHITIADSVSEEKALEAINRAYDNAKAKGFDNKDEKWIIVCNRVVKEFDGNGAFLKEDRCRFVVATAQYSTYENAYVLAY